MSHKQIALITGGTRGIGLGIAGALAREGWNLALCGTRDEAAVSEPVERLRGLGADVLYCRADVSKARDRDNLLTAIYGKLGTLNALINNAGIAPRVRADLLETTEESYDQVMDINLKGPYFLTQAIARDMIQAKRNNPRFPAFIVNISSISAIVASPSRGEYCISKAGMSMLTMLWAARLGEFDIPVYEVRPGITRTDMTDGVRDKYDKMIDEGLCVQQRWGDPEDTGKIVAAMLRGDFAYSTGQVVNVDGGLLLRRL